MNTKDLDSTYTRLTPNKTQWAIEKEHFPLEVLLSPLKFKTGGLRGLMREGFSGINEVTSNILATELCKRYNSIVIGYDHRANSDRFAYIFQKIFTLSNKQVRVYKHCITPYIAMESELHDAGLMITASHNSKEHNGFKLYENGSQIVDTLAKDIRRSLERCDFTEIYDRKTDRFMSPDWIEELSKYTHPIDFKKYFLNYSIPPSTDAKTVVPIFSALYGVSSPFIREACKYFNIEINMDSRHNNIDKDFPGVPFPNPEVEENWNALYDEMIMQNEIKDGILLMCDPDGDRFGMAQVKDGEMEIYNSNMIVKIFTWYFLKNYPSSEIILVNTFLCDGFFKVLSEKLGIQYSQTDTGFKNVSKGIRELLKEENISLMNTGQRSVQDLGRELEQTILSRQIRPFSKIVIAYEDPLGYILGRMKEKDGVLATVLMHQILQNHKISDIFDELKEFGTFTSYTVHLRLDNPEEILDKIVRLKPFDRVYDAYSIDENGLKICLRISGTESMIKIYSFSSNDNYALHKTDVDWWILKNVLCFCRKEHDYRA